MAFLLVIPHHGPHRLPLDEVAVDSHGGLRINSVALLQAGIGDTVALLADPDTHRIALRAAREDDPSVRVRRHGKGGVIKPTASLQISSAYRAAEIPFPPHTLRLKLTRHDDLIVLNFSTDLVPAGKQLRGTGVPPVTSSEQGGRSRRARKR